jgi:ABC-type phosphate transport system permease subunit
MISRHTSQKVAKGMIWLAALSTLAVMVWILLQVLIEGLPLLNLRFLLDAPRQMGRTGGIFSTIIGTLALTAVAIVIATPLGVGTAVYLREYTREGRVSRIIRFGTDCLAGVPSIIFGLFGFVFFVILLRMGWSILSGGLTLAAMILPTIICTAEEAIKAIPYSYQRRSGDFYGGSPGRWPERRGDRGHYSDRGLFSPHAHLPVFSDAHDVGSFLYPGPGRDLHGEGLCHRGSLDPADPGD